MPGRGRRRPPGGDRVEGGQGEQCAEGGTTQSNQALCEQLEEDVSFGEDEAMVIGLAEDEVGPTMDFSEEDDLFLQSIAEEPDVWADESIDERARIERERAIYRGYKAGSTIRSGDGMAIPTREDSGREQVSAGAQGPWSGPHGGAGEKDDRHLWWDAGLGTYDDGTTSVDIARTKGDYGVWGEPGHDARVGARGEIYSLKTREEGDTVEETAGPGAHAEMSAGDDGVSVGATANACGTTHTLESEHEDANRELKVGASQSTGFGARGHWGDADQDDRREYGFGFDYGFVSVDYKTEDPVKDVIPGGHLLDGNVTDEVASWF